MNGFLIQSFFHLITTDLTLDSFLFNVKCFNLYRKNCNTALCKKCINYFFVKRADRLSNVSFTFP